MVGQIRAGIVGLSWIGADTSAPASAEVLGTAPPYSHASAMAAIPEFDLVAVCDLRRELRESFIRTWADTWPNVRAYPDAASMLASGSFDLVSIVTPDHLHATTVELAIGASVPMIFCEKPLATNLDDADRIVRLAQSTGTTVGVNHTWRWRPDVVATRSAISSGELGPLSQIIIEFGGPRAMLFRNLSHFVDLAIYLFDDTPEWVIGHLESGQETYGSEYQGFGGADPNLDPGANIYVNFKGGGRAFISGLKASPQDYAIRALCSGGSLVIDALGARKVSAPRGADGTPSTFNEPSISTIHPLGIWSGMEAGIRDLVDAHYARREPSSSALSARWAVATLAAALESQADRNGRVEVPNIVAEGGSSGSSDFVRPIEGPTEKHTR